MMNSRVCARIPLGHHDAASKTKKTVKKKAAKRATATKTPKPSASAVKKRVAVAAMALVSLVAGTVCGGDDGDNAGAGGAGGEVATGPVDFGDFSRFADLAWIDAHVHLCAHLRIEDYVAYQNRFGMQRMVLLSAPNAASLMTGERPNANGEALLAKALHPDRFYVFGGIDLTPLLSGGEASLSADLAAQVNELADAGADGIKLYFRSTVVEQLKMPPLEFDYLPDNPALAPLFETAAARQLPLLVHIDPPYQQEGQAALSLYPTATWILTHLGFAGTNVSRLEAILGAAPNVYLDIGHYVHSGELLQAGAAARDFFIAHQDRVFQSSDLASGCDKWGLTDDMCPSEEMAVSQIWTLRAMLETTQDITFTSAYTGEEITVTGLGLPFETLRALYHDSADGLLGEPKPIQCAPALTHIDRLIDHTSHADDLVRLADLRSQLVDACP
jgi:hypothetical protein